MIKSSAAALLFLVGTSGAVFAQTRTADPMSAYDVSQFETQQVPVAVATDKASGKRFNVVKLPNGKMMVLVSADRVASFSPFADDSEMMFSGHSGTTR